MIDQIKKDAQDRMKKSLDALLSELSKLRTGRAHPSILEHITVENYGNQSPLNQVASISISDPRTLLVTPWDKNLVPIIEKAIMTSDLGLNPATSGQAIRVPLPALTEERRKDMTRIVRAEGEKARVSIRNIRRDANTQLKDNLKEKAISEDEERRGQDTIQKLTDQFIGDVDKELSKKESELMEV